MHLLKRIERYLKESRTPATRFGRLAVRDPRFVHDLRQGRRLRRNTERRVLAYLDRMGQQP